MAQWGAGKGRSGPGIAGGNHEVMEMDGRRMAPGPLDPRFQAARAEKMSIVNRHGQGTNQTMGDPFTFTIKPKTGSAVY